MPGQPAADQILDKYIRVIGGADRVSGLKSYAAKGASVGFGGFGGGGNVEKSPFAPFPTVALCRSSFPNRTGTPPAPTMAAKVGWRLHSRAPEVRVDRW